MGEEKMKKNLKRILLILIVGLITLSGWKYFESTQPIDIGNPQKGDFVKVGKIAVPRYNHNTLLLDDGRVLIYGGVKSGAKFFGAEIYNPKTRRFNSIGKPNKASGVLSMTLLKNKKVLFVGYYKETDLFDPQTNTFRLSGNLNYPRHHHTATLLDDGRVLIAGGQSIDSAKGFNNQGLNFAEYSEIYNPKTEKFTIGPRMKIPRSEHSTVLLKDGRVLIVGGFRKNEILTNAEIYDPKTNKFELASNMNIARKNPNVYLLKNGDVLISGGLEESQDDNKVFIREIEIYDPTTNEFKVIARRNSPARMPAELLLQDDKLLFTGGSTGVGLSLIYSKTSEIFDPITKKFVKGKDMNQFRAGHEMTLLKDGNVLISGSDTSERTAELYIYEDKK